MLFMVQETDQRILIGENTEVTIKVLTNAIEEYPLTEEEGDVL